MAGCPGLRGLSLALALLGVAGAQALDAVPMPRPVMPAPVAPVQGPPAQGSAAQEVTLPRVAAALALDRLAAALAAEIAASEDPLGAPGDEAMARAWADIAAGIAPESRIRAALRDGVGQALAGLDPVAKAEIGRALDFLDSPLGRRSVALELAAREALRGIEAEAAARADFAAATARNEDRVTQVLRLVEAADLVEPAVAATLNVALASAQAIADAAGLPKSSLVDDVWEMEPEIRADQTGWVEALVFVALSDLDDAEVDRLIEAAATPGARRLGNIVDGAATAVMTRIAAELGRASAAWHMGRKL